MTNKGLIVGGLVLSYLVLGNGLAFLDKAADRHLRDISGEQSAIESMLNYTPIVNSIGYGLGHKVFYESDLEITYNPS